MKEHTITVYGTITEIYCIEAEEEIEAENIACAKFNEDHPEAVIDDWEIED